MLLMNREDEEEDEEEEDVLGYNVGAKAPAPPNKRNTNSLMVNALLLLWCNCFRILMVHCKCSSYHNVVEEDGKNILVD